MDYNKIDISFIPFEEWLRDVLSSLLAEIGFESFVDSETGFEAYIRAPQFEEDNLNLILNSFEENFTFSVNKELIKSQNWNEEWEKNYFKPLVISDECVVRAPFHTEFPKAKYEIIIEPNMAFGTGNHETTSMMLEAILESEMKGKTILDMGCGTGILGILASMKGAKKITAIDIDEWSFNGTTENSTINNIQNIEVKHGDASLLGNEKYDVIFANIHKNILLNDMQTYSNCLNENGLLFLSGFYSHDLADIQKSAESHSLKFKENKEKNNWIVAVFQSA